MKHLISNSLSDSIEQGYVIFSKYKINKRLSIDSSFLSENEVKSLLATPLRKLSRNQIVSYVSEIPSDGVSVMETRYFLPRILELIAHRKVLYITEELSLSKCHFERKDLWKEDELHFLQTFAQTFFEDELARDNIELVSAINWLICFGLSGLEVKPLLKIWTEKASYLPTIWHFWELFTGIFVKDYTSFYCNYAESHPTFNEELTFWINDNYTLKTFHKAIENHLLSDEKFNSGALYQLETLYSVLGEKLSGKLSNH